MNKSENLNFTMNPVGTGISFALNHCNGKCTSCAGDRIGLGKSHFALFDATQIKELIL
jgi:hypothetical protein